MFESHSLPEIIEAVGGSETESLPKSKGQERTKRMPKYIATIPSTLPTAMQAEIIDVLNAAVTDFIASGVVVEVQTPRLSKAEKILIEIAAIAESGEFIDRNGIAAKVDCTVSLISAVFKDNADHAAVVSYLALEKNARELKKLQTQFRNFQQMQERMAKAGISQEMLAQVIQLPVTQTVDLSSADTNAVEASTEPLAIESVDSATVTPIASKPVNRRSGGKATS